MASDHPVAAVVAVSRTHTYQPKKHLLRFECSLRMERGRRDFIRAYVFHDRKTMREWMALAARRPRFFGNAEAAAHSWLVKGAPHDCGWVAFHAKQRGVGVLAHEMTHAAHYYLNRRRFKFGSRQWDEKMAWTVGYLCHQFVRKAEKAGMYK